MKRLMLWIAAFGMLASGTLHAQAPVPDWQTAAGGKMSFDVASVKQNKTGDMPKHNIPFDGDSYVSTGGVFRPAA
jgi:hypothetical protein